MDIKRDSYLQQLISYRFDGLVKVITGIRRCGKSYLLKNIYREYLLQNGVKEDRIIDRVWSEGGQCGPRVSGDDTIAYINL